MIYTDFGNLPPVPSKKPVRAVPGPMRDGGIECLGCGAIVKTFEHHQHGDSGFMPWPPSDGVERPNG